jgi:hypothetical protein
MASTLFYALAFNLVIFIQELFLVLHQALALGLSVALFHNKLNFMEYNFLACPPMLSHATVSATTR